MILKVELEEVELEEVAEDKMVSSLLYLITV